MEGHEKEILRLGPAWPLLHPSCSLPGREPLLMHREPRGFCREAACTHSRVAGERTLSGYIVLSINYAQRQCVSFRMSL